jgi:hypothetical protein
MMAQTCLLTFFLRALLATEFTLLNVLRIAGWLRLIPQADQ